MPALALLHGLGQSTSLSLRILNGKVHQRSSVPGVLNQVSFPFYNCSPLQSCIFYAFKNIISVWKDPEVWPDCQRDPTHREKLKNCNQIQPLPEWELFLQLISWSIHPLLSQRRSAAVNSHETVLSPFWTALITRFFLNLAKISSITSPHCS